MMGKNKVLVKVHPEGKYVVDLDKSIDIAQVRCSADLCALLRKPWAARSIAGVTSEPNKATAQLQSRSEREARQTAAWRARCGR